MIKFRTTLKKSKYNKLIYFDSVSNFDINNTDDTTSNDPTTKEEKYKNIDTSKQVIIKAGSIHLDDLKVSSRSNSRLKVANKSIASKIDDTPLQSHISNSKKSNIERSPNSIARVMKESLLESPITESRNKWSKVSILSNAIASLRNTAENSKYLSMK